MIKKYLLDLSAAKRPAFWPEAVPLQIRVEQGCHIKEFDISPSERDTFWYAELTLALQNFRARHGLPEANNEMPIGFDRSDLPTGAKLVELP